MSSPTEETQQAFATIEQIRKRHDECAWQVPKTDATALLHYLTEAHTATERAAGGPKRRQHTRGEVDGSVRSGAR